MPKSEKKEKKKADTEDVEMADPDIESVRDY